jgi:hypothetical protein
MKLAISLTLLLASTSHAQTYVPVPDFNGGLTYRATYRPYYGYRSGYYGSLRYQNYELRRIRYAVEDLEWRGQWRELNRR